MSIAKTLTSKLTWPYADGLCGIQYNFIYQSQCPYLSRICKIGIFVGVIYFNIILQAYTTVSGTERNASFINK